MDLTKIAIKKAIASNFKNDTSRTHLRIDHTLGLKCWLCEKVSTYGRRYTRPNVTFWGWEVAHHREDVRSETVKIGGDSPIKNLYKLEKTRHILIHEERLNKKNADEGEVEVEVY
jgi:hypothetical protein